MLRCYIFTKKTPRFTPKRTLLLLVSECISDGNRTRAGNDPRMQRCAYARKLASACIYPCICTYIRRHLNSELFVLQVFIDCIIRDALRRKIMGYERARDYSAFDYQHWTRASLLNVLLFFSNQYLRLFVTEARKITSHYFLFSSLPMKRKRWDYWE